MRTPQRNRLPLLIGLDAFYIIALPAASFVIASSAFLTILLEGPDLPGAPVWRALGLVGATLVMLLLFSPLALLFAIKSVFTVLIAAFRDRAADLWLDESGIRIRGGSHGGFVATWNELQNGSIVWDEKKGLHIEVEGRTVRLPPASSAEERVSLKALAATLQAAVMGRDLEAPRRAPPGVVRCHQCGAPLAPDVTATVRCGYCDAENTLPAELVDKVGALRRISTGRRRDEQLMRALLQQPGAWLANAFVFLGGGALLLLGCYTVLRLAGVALEMGLETGMPRMHGIGLMWIGSGMVLLGIVTWLLSSRRAMCLLTLGLGALTPEREGEPFACRACGGPLPEPAHGAMLVDCAFCDVENVRAVDARLHASMLQSFPGAASDPHEVLSGVARRRRRALYLAIAGLGVAGIGGAWRLVMRPIALQENQAVMVPFDGELRYPSSAEVVAGPDATRLEHVSWFPAWRMRLLGGPDARVDVVALYKEAVQLHELLPDAAGRATPWRRRDLKTEIWARDGEDYLTVDSNRIVALRLDGSERVLYDSEQWVDSIITGIAPGPEGLLFATTRRSKRGHLRLRLLGGGEQGRIYQHDMRRPALHPGGASVAVLLLRDDVFQIVLLNDIHASRAELLTRGHGNLDCPTWSPDGKALAFLTQAVQKTTSRLSGRRRLFVLELEPRRLLQLTDGGDLSDTCPVWTRDGIFAASLQKHPKTGTLQGAVVRVIPRR